MENCARSLTIWFVLLLVSCAGCSVNTRLNTASDRPEITLPAVRSRQQVRDAIVQNFLNDGYEFRRADEYGVVVGRRLTDLPLHQLLLGSRYDGVPEERLSVNTIDTGDRVRRLFSLQ